MASQIRKAAQHRPTRHALARALALGLAMAAGAPALAGSCDVSDPSAATCDGVFIGGNISYAIEDLTLVVGGDLDTTIDPADGLAGIALSSNYGDIDLVSYADITTHSANGIQASSYYGDIAIADFGLVDASVVYYGSVRGISANNFFGNVDVYVGADAVVSASTDNVYGGTATGVRASSSIGAASVENLGAIFASADADYGNATAYGVLDRGGYYGIASVENSGTISAEASTGNGVGWAWGTRVRGQQAELSNSGSISADAYTETGYASASAAYVRGGYYGSSHNANSGTIEAHAVVGEDGQALAYGMMSWGGDVYAYNDGEVAAYGEVASGTAVGMGANSYYDRTLSVHNAGSFLGDAYAGLGFAEAVGVAGYARDSSTLVNAYGGEIHAVSGVGNGYSFAYGILFAAGYYARLDNDGVIDAQATTYDSGAFQEYGGEARTIGASLVSAYGDSMLYNNYGASIGAISKVYGDYGRAYAFGAVAQGSNLAHLENAGTIVADAYSIAGNATSLGDLAYATFAVNANFGELSSSATVAGAGHALAIGQYSFGEVSTVINEGDTSASASVGQGEAYAVGARLQGAWVAGYNYAQLSASAYAESGVASAQGLGAYGFFAATLYNEGALGVSAIVGNGEADAIGAYAFAYAYGSYVSNSGTISASASAAYGSANAVGIASISYLYGPAEVDNTGELLVSASAPGDASATGISTKVYEGYSVVHNAGDIGALADSFGGMYGTADATGLHVDYYLGKYNFPVADISNSGTITATATREGQYGFASATGASVFAMYAMLYNGGEIVAEASAQGDGPGSSAVGVLMAAKYGAEAVNAGGVHAIATSIGGGSAAATGFGASAYYGGITLVNEGGISAVATASGGVYGGSAYAGGVHLHGDYATVLYNEGSIFAQAIAEGGGARAVGFDGSTKYDSAGVENHGDIVAIAQGYYATAIGSRTSSKYGAHTDNAELIAAYAQAHGYGSATATGSMTFGPGAHGYNYGASGAALYNDGQILAYASAQAGQAVAIGARVEAAQDAGAHTFNGGLILADAQSDGAAFATGSKTWSYYGDVSLLNEGSIRAQASGYDAVATGAIVRAEGFGPPSYPAGYAVLENAGTISALAEGANAFANAVSVSGEQGASVYNTGSLLAYADGAADSGAMAVYLGSEGLNLLSNEGLVLAASEGGEHIAVQSSAYGTARIDNHGRIAGSIVTGLLDDSLYNHASGSLWLSDDVIDLGGWSNAGNIFVNDGRLVVRGDGNAIDMGTVQSLLAAGGNPLAFVNDGVIDFVDGHADDVLVLHGDLAGEGSIAVDLDPAQGAGDLLVIEGDVDPDAVQGIDVQLASLPTSASTGVEVVTVYGLSSADNFVIGDVHSSVDPGFLALDFSVDAELHNGNAQPDRFRVDVEVSGLSDAGTLAAAVPTAVGQILASQAGGERAVVRTDDGEHGTSLWARVFHDKAKLDPKHEALDFGNGGNFAFEQRASGIEAGLDFAPNEQWCFGLLLFDVQSSQRLRGAGAGTGHLDGNGYGLYAGWASPWDLHFDGAWRHLRYEADVAGGSGRGDADSLDLQVAKTWTSAKGLRLEPQLQYTHSRVGGVEGLAVGDTNWQADATGSELVRLGINLSRDYGDSAQRWTPWLQVAALYEFDGDSDYAINGNFHGCESGEGAYARVEAGLDASFGAFSLSGSLRWQDGGVIDNAVDAQLQLRYRW